MNIHAVIIIGVAVAELMLGLYVLLRNRKDSISITFFALVVSIVIWVTANAVLVGSLQGIMNALYYKVAYFSGILIATTFVQFAWVFPYKSANTSKTVKTALSFIVLLFFALFFFSDVLIVDVVKNGNTSDITYGNIFSVYIAYFAGLFIWAFYVLISKAIKADGLHRWQLKLVIISVMIPFIVNITTDIIMPWLGYARGTWLVYLGAESSIVWVGLTSYILFKKNI
jgi:hypothetical protein